tara:strand:+ start:134 stop:1189 length:1056 start_codon:yes stop_codon:yes gene_type:complete
MRTKLTAALVIAILAAVIVWFSGVLTQHIAPGVKTDEQSYRGATHQVELSAINVAEVVPGQVIAKQNTQVSARVLAQIERFLVRAGDTVKQGQVVIELDKQALQSQVQQAKAQVNALQASLTQASKQLRRANELFAQGLISQNDIDVATANHDNLKASVEQAQQALQQAQIALQYATIKAPIAGRVVERFAEPGDTASPGQALLAIYNPQQLQLEFAVREGQALTLDIGTQRRVSIAALALHADVPLVEVVPAADSGSRSLLMRFAAPQSAKLLPGLYAQLELPASSRQGVLVAREWVHQHGQLDMVMVVKQGQLQRRYVRLGQIVDDQVEVLSGLSPGEIIATEAQPAAL